VGTLTSERIPDEQNAPFTIFCTRCGRQWRRSDLRKGRNKHYPLLDAALGAFACSSPSSPAFLASQRDLAAHKGQSNAPTLFGLTQIPSDNQIRALLDPVPPELLGAVFATG